MNYPRHKEIRKKSHCHSVNAFTNYLIVLLLKIYTTFKNGMGKLDTNLFIKLIK